VTHPTGKPKVICAGRVYGDLIFSGIQGVPSPGTETYCDRLSFHPGGGAFITAAHLAAHGHATALLATLPSAPFAEITRDKIASFGVDISHSDDAPPGTDPQITVAMVQGEDRAFLTRRDGPALPNDFAANVRTSGAKHLHIGELATLVECPELVQAAKAADMTVSLDCGWDPAVFDRRHAALIASVDVFLPNQAEQDALLDAGIAAPFSKLDVTKRGKNGASARWSGTMITAPAVQTDVHDPTGAGDAFNAGFLTAWLENAPIEDCLKSGNTAGARAVSYAGGAGCLRTQTAAQ